MRFVYIGVIITLPANLSILRKFTIYSSIVFCPLGVGRGASPVGALPPYLPLLLLCSLTHFEYPVQQSVLVTLLAEFSKCICIFPAVETSDNIGGEAIAIILDN